MPITSPATSEEPARVLRVSAHRAAGDVIQLGGVPGLQLRVRVWLHIAGPGSSPGSSSASSSGGAASLRLRAGQSAGGGGDRGAGEQSRRQAGHRATEAPHLGNGTAAVATVSNGTHPATAGANGYCSSGHTQ